MNDVLIALWTSIILNISLLFGTLFFVSRYIKLRKLFNSLCNKIKSKDNIKEKKHE